MRKLGHFYHASGAGVNVGSAMITCVCNRLKYGEWMRGGTIRALEPHRQHIPRRSYREERACCSRRSRVRVRQRRARRRPDAGAEAGRQENGGQEGRLHEENPASHGGGTVKTVGPDSVVVAGKAKGKDTEWTFALNDK